MNWPRRDFGKLPETQYVQVGDLSIAYQVFGRGEIDLVIMPALVSHVEQMHEVPGYTRFLERLCTFARVITFDKRGQGLSDRIGSAPSLEERMDDTRAVMDAVGSEKAALFGHSDGGAMAALFAATYPERVTGLILFGAFAKASASDDYPHMATREERWQRINSWAENWGKGTSLRAIAPQFADDDMRREIWAKTERLCGTPTSLKKYFAAVVDVDIRPVLPTISAPTLVMHRADDLQIPFAAAQHLADAIPGARIVDPGDGGHAFYNGDQERFVGEIQEFLTGQRLVAPRADRVLSTLVFTDIVNSTETLASVGDAKWRELLDDHDAIVRQTLDIYGGNLIKHTGDGVLATFDGPGRAIQCACECRDRVKSLGLETRSGIHTGEIEIREEDVSGVAVHLASRIMSTAAPGEVVVSRLVADLVSGSEVFHFEDLGEHALRGISGNWNLYRATLQG